MKSQILIVGGFWWRKITSTWSYLYFNLGILGKLGLVYNDRNKLYRIKFAHTFILFYYIHTKFLIGFISSCTHFIKVATMPVRQHWRTRIESNLTTTKPSTAQAIHVEYYFSSRYRSCDQIRYHEGGKWQLLCITLKWSMISVNKYTWPIDISSPGDIELSRYDLSVLHDRAACNNQQRYFQQKYRTILCRLIKFWEIITDVSSEATFDNAVRVANHKVKCICM